ncbi:hypothetical protein DENSPDRAFT_886594 [Dentipellis sp. KUC8613]|nr:hypothetical protein DENSPDRAFT_886594 [Dentipellis sp. KUC8613]
MPTCANNSHPSPIAHVPLIAPILLITFCVLSHRLRPTPPFAPHATICAPPRTLRTPWGRLTPPPHCAPHPAVLRLAPTPSARRAARCQYPATHFRATWGHLLPRPSSASTPGGADPRRQKLSRHRSAPSCVARPCAAARGPRAIIACPYTATTRCCPAVMRCGVAVPWPGTPRCHLGLLSAVTRPCSVVSALWCPTDVDPRTGNATACSSDVAPRVNAAVPRPSYGASLPCTRLLDPRQAPSHGLWPTVSRPHPAVTCLSASVVPSCPSGAFACRCPSAAPPPPFHAHARLSCTCVTVSHPCRRFVLTC